MKRYVLILLLAITSTGLVAQDSLNQEKMDFALMDAAYDGNVDSVIYWIKAGANVNARNANTQETALIYASQQGHLDIVKILLKNNADPNLNPMNDEGALIRAVATGHRKIAEELIRYDADLQQTGNLGKTPLHYAVSFGYYYITDMLIYYGANVNETADENVTPLLLSISAGYPAIAELLLRKGADPNISDLKGFTPLMLASRYNYQKLVAFLLEKDAKISPTTEKNNTALVQAIAGGNTAITDTLLEVGANINHKMSECMTPLTFSKFTGQDSITDLLRENNASQNLIPCFDWSLFRYSISANADDAIFGTHYTLHETKTNTNISLGFSLRYFAQQVWEEKSDDLIYQYWERRYLFPLSIDKLFDLKYTFNERISILTGIKGYYTWGRYRGVSAKPDDKFGLSPRVGIYWKMARNFGLSLHYEYFNLEQQKISPHRIVLSINIHNLRNKNLTETSKANYLLKY